MELKIRELSWFKRRIPTKEIKAISAQVHDLKKRENHTCDMVVEYSDKSVHTLTGHVNVNHVGKWTVAGYDPHGRMVMCDIIE